MPSTSEIVDDAITSATLAGAKQAFKSLWKNNPQLSNSMSDMAKDQAFKYAAKFLVEFGAGFDIKGLKGLAEFFAGH